MTQDSIRNRDMTLAQLAEIERLRRRSTVNPVQTFYDLMSASAVDESFLNGIRASIAGVRKQGPMESTKFMEEVDGIVSLKVMHCRECAGTGRIRSLQVAEDEYDNAYGSYRTTECPACCGTGHTAIWEQPVATAPEPTAEAINPAVGLHDPAYCSGYIEGSCEADPCPDCELGYDAREE